MDLATRDSDTVASFGPDYANSSIAVDVTNADATTLTALEQASATIHDSVPIDVVEGARRARTTSRYYDTTPYYGGNAIGLSSTDGSSRFECSTGFQMFSSSDGYAYAVTAGHCYTQAGHPAHPSVAIIR